MTQPATGSRARAERDRAAPVLALDFGGTQLRAAVVAPDGDIVGRTVARTPRGGAQPIVDECVALLEEAAAAHRRTGRPPPRALGISAPGPLDSRTGVLLDPPNLDRSLWRFPLAGTLARALGLPAALDKDTNVAALAEGRFGAARGIADYVYLTVSTGVGGAVVDGGRLVTGADGAGGELGHLMVDPAGPACGCGVRGHLEAFSSGTGIAARVREAFASGAVEPGTPLAVLARERGIDQLEARDVADAEDRGDALAAGIMAAARDAFASAMVTIVNVFNPARIIVGGGICLGQGERLLAPARRRVREYAFSVQGERAEITATTLGDDVGLLGALPLVEQRPSAQAASPSSDRQPSATVAGRLGLPIDSSSADDSSRTHEQRRAPAVGGRAAARTTMTTRAVEERRQ